MKKLPIRRAMKNTTDYSRRRFIKGLAGTAVVSGTPAIMLGNQIKKPEELTEKPFSRSANDQVQIAVIGAGIMGFKNVETAVKVPGVKLVAACDLYDGRLTRMKEVYGKDIFTTRDYQEILNREEIDAVIIATSDHWHDRISIDAMKKGKAVYCEKPMVHHLDEGHAVIKTQQKTGKTMQVGSQRVSSILYEKAAELLKAGDIGELVLVEASFDRQSALGAWQYSIPTDASPQTVDWERFQGDAPKMPYDPKRFFRWRNYQDYGTGVAGDLFVHLFSGLHVITGSHGPNRIFTTGGLRYWKDGRDVPDVMIGCFDYPETEQHHAFNLQLRVNFIDGGGGGGVFRLIGTEGVMEMGWSGLKITRNPLPAKPGYGGWDSFFTFPKAIQDAYEEQYEKVWANVKPSVIEPQVQEYKTPDGYSDHLAHFSNFFDGVRTGAAVVEDPTFGLGAAGPSLAANMSYFQGKPIVWDPEKMMVKE